MSSQIRTEYPLDKIRTQYPSLANLDESMEEWWNKHHSANDKFWLSGYKGADIWQSLGISDYIRPGKIVLNIGIGLGHCTQELVNRQAIVHGLDISVVALEKVKSICAEVWVPSQLDKLPSDYFDLAISHLVTQHMNDSDLLDQIQAVIRGLKPDGIFAMQFAFSKSFNPTSCDNTECAKGGGVSRNLSQMETFVDKVGGQIVWASKIGEFPDFGVGWYGIHIVKKGIKYLNQYLVNKYRCEQFKIFEMEGTRLSELGDFEGAHLAMSRAIQMYPENEAARQKLIQLSAKNSKYDEIYKYDYLYQNNPAYGQINTDEPRFVVALNYTNSIQGVKTILDAGVGRGGFYNLIKTRYDVFGLEPSQTAITKFHSGDQRIKNILIQEIPGHYQQATFDLVTCLDVLEHIPISEIDETLRAIQFVGEKYYVISVASHEDVIDGLNLHVNLRSYQEWEQDFQRFFNIISQTFIHNRRSCVYLLENKFATSVNLSFDQYKFSKLQHKDDPLFSILVPTYNQAEYLPEALDSLLAQTYQKWEAIVVNDGSTDETPAVLEQYIARDSRIKVFHKENGGVGSALNEALRYATGAWICWLSTDDIFVPDKLEVHVQVIRQNPEVRIFFSNFYTFDQSTGIKQAVDRTPFSPELQCLVFLKWNPIAGNSVAIHRSVFDRVGIFDETLRNGQDFDMWLRIAACYPIYLIPHRTYISRWHSEMGTMVFAEAGIYDSARSCIHYLNTHDFPALFPFLDFNNPNHFQTAVEQTIRLSLDITAFMYQGVGFITPLLDRLLEWLSGSIPETVRSSLLTEIAGLADSFPEGQLPEAIRQSLRRFTEFGLVKFHYSAYDPIMAMKNQLARLEAIHQDTEAAPLKRYLGRLDQYNQISLANYAPLPASTILMQPPESAAQVSLFGIDVGHGQIKLHLEGLVDGVTPFNGTTQLGEFESLNNIGVSFPDGRTEFLALMPTLFAYWKGDYDFVAESRRFEQVFKHTDQKPGVAFTVKSSDVLGGGSANVFRYANWLVELGFPVTIYSDTAKPQWTDVNCSFVSIKDEQERYQAITEPVIIVYSILELPPLLRFGPKTGRRIFHLCQGLEDFHLGSPDYKSVKPLFQLLNSLPVGRLTVSNHLTTHYRQHFGQISYQITNGIDHQVFKPRPSKPVTREITMMTIGIPVHHLKNIIVIQEAVAVLKRQHPDWRLKVVIVSGVNVPAEFMRGRFNQDVDVNIHCAVSAEKVRELFYTADVYINASWYEGFGLPSLEAMACGVPVAQANNQGLTNIAKDGFNCLMFEPGSSTQLTTVLERLLTNYQLREELIKNGVNTAAQFPRIRQYREFIEAFQNILGITFDSNLVERRVKQLDSSTQSDITAKKPFFSVLVPTYNQAVYLGQALDSLLKQTYSEWEAIVINDGSTDDTSAMMTTYAARDQRIRPFHKPNGGVASALNVGLQQAQGDWICWLSSDDLFEPDALTTFVQAIQQNSMARFFHSHFYELSEATGQKTATWNDRYQTIPAPPVQTLAFFQANYVHGISVAIHRSVFETVGNFDESYPSAQDVNMWLRISAKYPLFFINYRTCVTRMHDASGTSAFPEACFFDIARSSIEFLNQHPFQEIFPNLNWDNPQHVGLAIEQSLRVGLELRALMYQGVGPIPALLERLGEWYTRYCPPIYKQHLASVFQSVAESVAGSDLPERIKTTMVHIVENKPISYQPYDPFSLFAQQQNWLEAHNYQSQAVTIQRYRDKIEALLAKLNRTQVADSVDPQQVFTTAQNYMDQNQPEEAIPHLLQALQAQPASKPAVKMLARAYLLGQQKDRLPGLYHDFVKDKPAFSPTEKAWFENMLPREAIQ